MGQAVSASRSGRRATLSTPFRDSQYPLRGLERDSQYPLERDSQYPLAPPGGPAVSRDREYPLSRRRGGERDREYPVSVRGRSDTLVMANQPRRHAGAPGGTAPRQGSLDTDLARSPLFAMSGAQLELPVDGPSLLMALRASGRLKLSPDLDVLAWLSEELRLERDPGGWVPFTLYELGSAVYGVKPTTRHRELLRASLRRLVTIVIDLIGYDAKTGKADARIATVDHLIDRVRSELDDVDVAGDASRVGALRGSSFQAQFSPWLRQQIETGHVTYLRWPLLVHFSGLAKRLWVLLEAEQFKRQAGGRQVAWRALGDRLYGTLGMHYDRSRDARVALKRAAAQIVTDDKRYVSIELVPRGRSWLLIATRIASTERAAVARAAAQSLASTATPATGDDGQLAL